MLKKLEPWSYTMKIESISEVKIQYNYVVFALIGALIGFLILYIGELYRVDLGHWINFTNNIASILIIAGSFAALQEVFIKRSFLREIYNSELRISNSILNTETFKQIAKIGINGCEYGGRSFDYQPYIENSTSLTCTLNSGSSWISGNMIAIEVLMQKENSTINLIMPHPTGEYASILEKKEKKPTGEIKRKIIESADKLITAYYRINNPSCHLKIYWHNLPVVHACYIFDINGILTPYTLSSERMPIPSIIFRKTSNKDLYDHFLNDCKRVMCNERFLAVEIHNNNSNTSIYDSLKS